MSPVYIYDREKENIGYQYYYMEYSGDIFRHYIRNYWYEVGADMTIAVRNVSTTLRIQSRSDQI